MVSGLSHITLIVKDLERSAQFLKAVFGAKEVYSSGGRAYSLSREKFFIIGGVWMCLMEGEQPAERTYNHVAFRIPEDETGEYERRIEAAGAEIKPGRPRVGGEGRSIYFYDFDNHLFELHTGTLDERLRRYAAGE